jgi:uncharacterized membrane protein
MPNIAAYHPQIVHFTIALLVLGVAFRWVSLTGRVPFASPTAATLLLLGAIAALLAVHSGTQAHGPVERIPGVREAVQVHEDAGEWTRTIFLIVAGIEVAALAFARAAWRRWLHVASALGGLVGGAALYKAGARGGDLVYSYAGGVGIRTGDTTDVERLLVAALYQRAMVARAQHQPADAAALIEQLSRRDSADTTVQLLRIESLILDKQDGTGALAALAGLHIPPDNRRLQLRYGMLKADAFVAAGHPDSAKATLNALIQAYPDVPRLRERLAKIP